MDIGGKVRISPTEGIQAFYYIAHLDNVRDILRDGVWSHNKAVKREPPPTRVSNSHVNIRRGSKNIDGKLLWDFANFYIQPHNAMLRSLENQDVVVLQFRRSVMDIPGSYISVGNAATDAAVFYPAAEGVQKLLERDICKVLNYDWWYKNSENKSIMMSELLVPNCVPPEEIDKIYLPPGNENVKTTVDEMTTKIPVELSLLFLWN